MKKLAKFYFKNNKTYKEARRKALINIVNRTDIYRLSNNDVCLFWSELIKLYK